MERERESKGKHCGLWTGPNANTALPSVDEGLLALSRNQVVPRRNTGRGREKGGRERERNRGKKGKERPSERMDNGQMSVHRALSISHATNWGANRFVRVRILLFVRPWKMSCPDARDGRGKIFHKHEYFATTVAASDERRFRA